MRGKSNVITKLRQKCNSLFIKHNTIQNPRHVFRNNSCVLSQ